jgi:uncharacterized protein YuzE
MITTSYDPEADAFAARFAPQDATSAETREVAPGVMLDFDAEGNVIGVEVLSIRFAPFRALPRLAESKVGRRMSFGRSAHTHQILRLSYAQCSSAWRWRRRQSRLPGSQFTWICLMCRRIAFHRPI